MGFLSTTPEDDANIAAEGTGPGEGTNQLPAPGAFTDFGGAVGRSVVGGLAAVSQFSQDVVDEAGQFTNEHPLARLIPGVAPLAAEYNLQQHFLTDEERKRNQEYLDDAIAFGKFDPGTTGRASMIAGDAAKGLTEYGIGSIGGPWGAAALLGGTSADEEYRSLREQGLDKTTAGENAAITGVTNAAFALFPARFGKSLIGGTAKAVGAGVGLGIASRYAQPAVLDANGYSEMAKMVRPFDAESMLSDAIMTGFFNVAGHFGAKLGEKPSDVDAAQAVQVETHFNNSGFGVHTDPEAANLHADTLAAHIDAMTRDADPAPLDSDTAQKLAAGAIVDPEPMAVAQEMHEALNADPDVRAVREAPVLREVPFAPMASEGTEANADASATQTPVADFSAQPSQTPWPATVDAVTADVLTHLQADHGDKIITSDDGREIPVAQHIEELRQQAQDAENYSKLFTVAVSCFLRTGGAV